MSWVWVVAWAALIFVLSSFSELPRIPTASADKYAHFVAYGVLATLTAHAFASGVWSAVRWRHAWLGVGVTLLYGVTDELHQAFVPGRHTSLGDLAADAAGAFIGVGLLWACAIIAATWRVPRDAPVGHHPGSPHGVRASSGRAHGRDGHDHHQPASGAQRAQ